MTRTATSVAPNAEATLTSHSLLARRIGSRRQHLTERVSSPPVIQQPAPVLSPLAISICSPASSDPAQTDPLLNKLTRTARYRNYVPDEETIRNDYLQRYIDGGEWPQNWVLGAEPEQRFEEYPKQQRLLGLKKTSVASHAHPPAYLAFKSLSTLHPSKFDVVLIDPPFSSSFTWKDLADLPIPALAAEPSFVFLWVGSGAGEGLERGRETLAKWGYRRCEDIVWIKTNRFSNGGSGADPPTTSLLTRTKQHCLMGIRGTVRRSTDSWFVHCNIDTDVIVWEGDSRDPARKPPEMYTLIENFCLGTRRLELFGHLHSLRPGWVTLGDFDLPLVGTLEARVWDRGWWELELQKYSGGRAVVPNTAEIDALRPKSPVRNNGASAAQTRHQAPLQQQSFPANGGGHSFQGGFSTAINQAGLGLGLSPLPMQMGTMDMAMAAYMGGPGMNLGGSALVGPGMGWPMVPSDVANIAAMRMGGANVTPMLPTYTNEWQSARMQGGGWEWGMGEQDARNMEYWPGSFH